jgi:hypothetical protein
MNDRHVSGHPLFVATERFLGHAAAVLVGIVLMFAGLAMSVTMVLLPAGIPVGLVGLLLFLWGLFSVPEHAKS